MGVDGIIVSNHGGRQLDTVPSTIEMLVPIAKALKKKDPNSPMELYVDGGIRRGNDIIKALALGAKAVLIGRSMLWGLAAGGQEGVEKVLECHISLSGGCLPEGTGGCGAEAWVSCLSMVRIWFSSRLCHLQ